MLRASFANVRRVLLSSSGNPGFPYFRQMSSNASGKSDVWEQKKELRKSVREALKTLTDDQKASESAKIASRVLSSSFFQKSKRTALFLSVPKLNEVDTDRLVDALLQDPSKRCYAPSVLNKKSDMAFYHVDKIDCVKSMPPYGIREPEDIYEDLRPREEALKMDAPLEVLIMTGQAFDTEGNRLGRGGGYYDKYIAKSINRAKQQKWERPLLVALAFEEQVVNTTVPTTPNDQSMDVLITPQEAKAFTRQGKAALE